MDGNENTINVDKTDIEILYILYTKNKKSPMQSLQIKSVENLMEVKVSYFTLIRRFNKLVNEGLLTEGYKVGNAKSYYINDNGTDFLENSVFSKEDVYEYVEIDNEDINKEDM